MKYIKLFSVIIGFVSGLYLIFIGYLSFSGQIDVKKEGYYRNASAYNAEYVSSDETEYNGQVNNITESSYMSRSVYMDISEYLSRAIGLFSIGLGGIAIAAFIIVLSECLPLQNNKTVGDINFYETFNTEKGMEDIYNNEDMFCDEYDDKYDIMSDLTKDL